MDSYMDKRNGRMWIACNECERGGNGSDEMKCSSGWKCKRFSGQGCFSGMLLDSLREKAEP